jgi:hypothetical protein
MLKSLSTDSDLWIVPSLSILHHKPKKTYWERTISPY